MQAPTRDCTVALPAHSGQVLRFFDTFFVMSVVVSETALERLGKCLVRFLLLLSLFLFLVDLADEVLAIR